MSDLIAKIDPMMNQIFRAERDLCKTKIREYCLAMNETNQYYLNESYAEQKIYGGIIAPPSFVEIIAKKAWSEFYRALEWDPNLVLMCTYKMKCKRLIRPYMNLIVNARITSCKQKIKYYFLDIHHKIVKDNSHLIAEIDVTLAYPINPEK